MEKLKTINIKGKDYVEVNERLKYFRKSYPNFSLETEILQCTDAHCVFKATIKDELGRVLASGHAHEVQSSSYINKSSFVENCETSAWGRALANFGIGIDSSVCSAQELSMALAQQKSKPVVKTTNKKMTSEIFDAMLNAIKDGKSDLVKSKMNDYKMTKTQKESLQKELN
jgi:hypothetical protein|tara:strand:+ start:551 stop:1063 length:513 start_codon:yes stop_codon:yes gene_type:complete